MSENNFWENIDEDYYRDVLGNMKRKEKSERVRFGMLGKGIHPNYEVTRESGNKECFKGVNHKPYEGFELYEPEHISDPYDYTDVQRFIAKAMTK